MQENTSLTSAMTSYHVLPSSLGSHIVRSCCHVVLVELLNNLESKGTLEPVPTSFFAESKLLRANFRVTLIHTVKYTSFQPVKPYNSLFPRRVQRGKPVVTFKDKNVFLAVDMQGKDHKAKPSQLMVLFNFA